MMDEASFCLDEVDGPKWHTYCVLGPLVEALALDSQTRSDDLADRCDTLKPPLGETSLENSENDESCIRFAVAPIMVQQPCKLHTF